MTRKTALAGAAMSVASLVSATLAIAATMDLPLLGLGGNSGAAATTQTVGDTDALTTTTTVAAPVVVERVVYEDVYERVERPTAPRVAAAVEPEATMPAPTQPSVTPTTTVAPTSTRSNSTTAPTTTRLATTTRITTTRPAPPPNCQEPEWDREHQSWHCKGD